MSGLLLDAVRQPPHRIAAPLFELTNPLVDDDLHLALYVCYELHYRSFSGVDDGWEWAPSLLALRARLERAFEAALREEAPDVRVDDHADVDRALVDLATGGGDDRSLSAFVADQGTLEQVRELAAHRSAYQLKEADPHTWAIPRLPSGTAKAALVDIQADEYGNGDPASMHSALFADTMAALDLDPAYGAYLDDLPGPTLATVNLVSMLGLHRRLRGALVGHLALFEMTSVAPMGRYAAALRRLGLGDKACRFYDVHVEADAVHEVVARQDMAVALAQQDPDLGPDIVFGAQAVTAVEGRFSRHALDAWANGRSSLRKPAPQAATA